MAVVGVRVPKRLEQGLDQAHLEGLRGVTVLRLPVAVAAFAEDPPQLRADGLHLVCAEGRFRALPTRYLE